MSPPGALEGFLSPDPIDAGCGETIAMLDVYVDLLLAGGDPERLLPGIATHLRDCPPCRQDLEGLLAAARRR